MFKLFDNPPKAVIAIVLLIVAFTAYKCNATEIEIGPTYTGGFNGGVALALSERVFDDKIDIGVSIISSQSWENVQVENNGSFWFAFVAKKPERWSRLLPDEFLIGGNYWFKTQSPINGAKEGYMLGLRYKTSDKLPKLFPDLISIKHFSNAGTNAPNRGQDMLLFGWRF